LATEVRHSGKLPSLHTTDVTGSQLSGSIVDGMLPGCRLTFLLSNIVVLTLFIMPFYACVCTNTEILQLKSIGIFVKKFFLRFAHTTEISPLAILNDFEILQGGVL
jgi:hypothetical protein